MSGKILIYTQSSGVRGRELQLYSMVNIDQKGKMA